MVKRIDSLTKEQKSMMAIWAKKWIDIGLKTGETDWETFEKYIKVCYQKAGIEFPKKIIRVNSPIVGAFAVGMALSSTKVFEKVEGYVSKLSLIFAPFFFAFIGAQVDFRGINVEILMLSGIMIVVAVVTKLFGCSLPSLMFLKDKKKSMQVGIGMISRGEVGLIVAGIGVASGILTSSVYSTIVIMVAVTTIITPLWLKSSYKKEMMTQDFTIDYDIF